MGVKMKFTVGVVVLLGLIAALAIVGILDTQGTTRTVLLALAIATVVVCAALWYFMQRALARPFSAAESFANRIAAGDLTVPIDTQGGGEFGKLMLALRAMEDNLTRMVHDIRAASEAIVTSATEVAAGNGNLSKRTEVQASTLEETASSMASLTTAVRDTTDNARRANELAKNANGVAVAGGMLMGGVVATMNEIQDSSRKIADITSVIDGIAFQTNILALNAAVEAARAGEQGRGFAVVASEVRGLAQRSADAAREIKALIGGSVDKVDAGTRQVESAGKTMKEIVDAVGRVTQIIDQISTACAEQAGGIEQVNQAIGQMEQVVQQNAAVVEQATAAAESMRSQADRLREVASVFKIDEDQAQQLNRRRDRSRDPWAPATVVRPAAAPAPQAATAKPAAPALPPRGADDGDWKEF
jgi:methyl-accepting chemotaxis protein